MKNQKIAIITLGCSKNTVESESVAGLFVKDGFLLTNDVNDADMILIHTCSFIQDAQVESRIQIENACKMKLERNNLKVFVSGCLPQLLKEKMTAMYPLIDGYTGTGAFGKIVGLVKKNKFFSDTAVAGGMNDSRRRILSGILPSAYIKIAEGCNHRCSFCIIPELRGKYKSRNIKSIVDEAKALADAGIREINVIAQDTTSYGTDIYGKPRTDKLLKEMSKIKDLKWIRLLYAYPSTVTESLLETIRENENICDYLDIPVQHINKKMLLSMKRPLNTYKIIENIKNKFPEIFLRTSLITGFPGETEKDFNELVQFVRKNLFEHVGIFSYSDQKTACSSKLKNKISKAVAEQRKQILANVQFENVAKNNSAKNGCEFEVFIESADNKKAYGRAYFQAPEIDSGIIINNRNKELIPGTFEKIKITSFKDYDLIGN
ncbi:MAG: 30S ribosomal protein S12 methylthiotransferase RimO [Endomicrobiaceae bacterium]